MNLIEQFLQQNLTKDLNHQLLSQIQQQNTAVESLVSGLEDIRRKQNIQSIQNKINRIEGYIELKKQIIATLQPLNTNTTAIFDWMLNSFVDNSFLYELIKREEFFIQKELIQIGKKVLLDVNYQHQHHQDTQFSNKIIRELHLLKQEKSQVSKQMNRQKIKEIDYGMEIFQQKIKAFQAKTANFNTQILLFLRKIYAFDEKIRNDFYQHFKSEISYQVETPQSNQENENIYTVQNSQKSHISINSHNQQSQTRLLNQQQFYETQGTPRKFLETEGNDLLERKKADARKSMVEKRRSTVDEKRSIHDGKSSFYQNRGSILQNKRSSIDFKRPQQKYSQILYQDEIRNMGKTLSTFNYHRPQSSNMLYTSNDFGRQIRLPTKWAQNSRSSISYYPPR